MSPARPEAGLIIAIDSATARVVVAVGTTAGTVVDATDWTAGYRHGETLLPAIDGLLDRLDIALADIVAIVVGIGPGAFTGLRVGVATAKGLAHALRRPIIGISTAEALLAVAGPGSVLLLPAGPSDRLIVRRGQPAQRLPAGVEVEVSADQRLVAIDLAGRAPDDAVQRGDVAIARLGGSLVTLGAARLTAGDVDDLAGLVPQYVTLPRGVHADGGEVSWSHDRR
jgi:tRNA threonylcarbamoyl adenosine modification protein YeaZ